VVVVDAMMINMVLFDLLMDTNLKPMSREWTPFVSFVASSQ